jgi:membrane-associated phospholipid phosphatase
MDSPPAITALQNISRWRPVLLVVLMMCGGLLLASWWIEGSFTRDLWDRLDRGGFFRLNGSLAEGRGWQMFWAVTNMRAFDVVGGLFILVVYAHYAFAQQRALLAERLAMFIVLAGVILLALELSKLLMAFGRHSPSRVLQPVYLLNEMFPDIPAKIRSKNSFPGDHATVLAIWASFMWLFAGWRYGLVAVSGAVFLSLPRLVGGGHWLTDDIVGAGVVMLFSLPLLICTPLCARAVSLLRPCMRWFLNSIKWLLPYTPADEREGNTG